MALLIPNEFASFELSQYEEEQGTILTSLQKQVIQNKLSMLASEKLTLVFTPNDINTYMQQEAELEGQLGILRWLLATSEEMEKVLADRLADKSNQV